DKLATRLPGGDGRVVDGSRRRARAPRWAGREGGILQQPLVDADVEGTPCPTSREHETQGPRSSPPPPDPHQPLLDRGERSSGFIVEGRRGGKGRRTPAART